MKRSMLCAVLAVVLCGCFGSSAYRANQENEVVKLVPAQQKAKVRNAIIRGGLNRDWRVASETDGCIRLHLDVRGGKHQVDVDVFYTENDFTVKYVSSVNMEYDPVDGTIHRKYVQWVRNLKQEIYTESAKP